MSGKFELKVDVKAHKRKGLSRSGQPMIFAISPAEISEPYQEKLSKTGRVG